MSLTGSMDWPSTYVHPDYRSTISRTFQVGTIRTWWTMQVSNILGTMVWELINHNTLDTKLALIRTWMLFAWMELIQLEGRRAFIVSYPEDTKRNQVCLHAGTIFLCMCLAICKPIGTIWQCNLNEFLNVSSTGSVITLRNCKSKWL